MWPAVIAGGLMAAGAVGNYMGNRAAADRASEAYDKIKGLAEGTSTANQADINSYKNLIAQTYGQGAANYSNALQNFLNSDVYQNKDFTYGNDINSFMDPAANQRVDAAMAAIENSAAGSGSRFSSDFINRVGAKQQALASEEWEKAYNRLMQDRQMALNEYNVNSQNAWNNYNATNARNQYAVDAYGKDREAYTGGLGDALSAGIANRNAVLQSQANAIAGAANAQQGTSGWDLLGGLGGAGGQFLSSWFGGGK
jgi:hypothetical protein